MPYLPLFATPPEPASHPLKLLQANVEFINKKTDALKQLIAAEDPDIISVQETNTAFAALFKSLHKQYPYQAVFAEDHDAAGQAVLSKLPFGHIEDVVFPNAVMPTQIFDVKNGKDTVTFFSLHTSNPLFGVPNRDAAFTGVAARLAKDRPARLVLIGDFNATPWCPGMRRFVDAQPDLDLARTGRGLLASWPAFYPFPFRIPIDELVVSRNIAVQDYRLGPDIGSDHLPMISTIALKGAK
jgi:endonuclease/exonuclease/phosphatase (EEP) superfamily protein YafD